MKRCLVSFLAIIGLSTLTPVAACAFELTSPDIQAGKTIGQKFVYDGMGCGGENVSPELAWSDPPAGAKSFAVTVHDPDAPMSGGFWHWVVIDIPASAKGLAQGAGTQDGKGLPGGSVQIEADFGAPGWGGPCPPKGAGAHHYNFTAYALGVEKLPLPANAAAAAVGAFVEKNAVGKATFTALYGR